jgi:hypothetical protein
MAILSLAGVVPTLAGRRSTDEKLPGAVAHCPLCAHQSPASTRRRAASVDRSFGRRAARRVARSRQERDPYVVLRARPLGPPFRRQGPRRVGGCEAASRAQQTARFPRRPVDATPNFGKGRAVRCIPTTVAPRTPDRCRLGGRSMWNQRGRRRCGAIPHRRGLPSHASTASTCLPVRLSLAVRLCLRLGEDVREHGEDAPVVVLARGQTELVEDRAHMLLHGARGNGQSLADRLVGAALGDELEH